MILMWIQKPAELASQDNKNITLMPQSIEVGWYGLTSLALPKRNSPFCVSSMFQKSNGCQETIIVRVIQWLPAINRFFGSFQCTAPTVTDALKSFASSHITSTFGNVGRKYGQIYSC